MFNVRVRFCAAAMLGAAVLLIPAAALAVDKLVTLLTFDGNDGSSPGAITVDGKGNLFGTTHYGGNGEYGPGSIYEMSWMKGSGWSLSSLYDFNFGDDGGYPNTAPVIGRDGALYGATLGGSGGNAPGGLVYGLVPQAGS